MNRYSQTVCILMVPFIAAAVLAGCSAGGDEASPSDEVGGSTGELGEADSDDLAIGGDTDCITDRAWVLDIPDLASQIAIELATTDGFEVLEQAGTGLVTLQFFEDSGTLLSVVDMLISITVTTDAPSQITLVQIHNGAPSADWGWRGNTNAMEFANWNSGGYTVENLMTVNGISLDSTIPIPSDPLTGTAMTVECAGSKMTTVTEGSPYIHRWTADD